MCAQWWLCVVVLLLSDGAHSWFEDSYRRGSSRRVFSYPRDWDVDWSASQRHHYGYQAEPGAALRPRLEVVPGGRAETRGVWHSRQRGSAEVPYPGATVHVRPSGHSKFYRGTITSTITDGSSFERRSNKNHRHGSRGRPEYWQYSGDQPAYRPPGPRPKVCARCPSDRAVLAKRGADTVLMWGLLAGRPEYWQYSGDQPAYRPPGPRPKVCARCPSDRAVLAKRGADAVLMEVPPTIPCHPWSSVEKVKQEIVFGPQPGSEVPEGSHKVVIRLYHRRRTLATCVIRYNVIVRQCEELVSSPGVQVSCPQGKAWGAHCNFSCDPGYRLEGDSYVECTDNLEWSGEVPSCLPTTSCAVPAGPDHGHLSCRTPQHRPTAALGLVPDGSVCRYVCDAGYTVPPTLQRYSEVRCVAGNWDNHIDPACVETNELEDEEFPTEITDLGTPSFDGVGCPEGFCQNGGRCIMILNSPMCSCLSGHTGLFCEDQDSTLDQGPDQSNSIT